MYRHAQRLERELHTVLYQTLPNAVAELSVILDIEPVRRPPYPNPTQPNPTQPCPILPDPSATDLASAHLARPRTRQIAPTVGVEADGPETLVKGDLSIAIREEIARGRYSSIHVADMASSGDGRRRVVVKKTSKARYFCEAGMYRLAWHQRCVASGSASSVRHPNILYVEHSFMTREHLYFVMPQFGVSDAFELARTHAVGETAARRVVELVLGALAHLHERGFAHRDVKSENVLVDYRTDDRGASRTAWPLGRLVA